MKGGRFKMRSAKENGDDAGDGDSFRDEDHDQIIEDLVLLRNYYKSVYRRSLEGKVQQQRKRLQESKKKILDEEQQAREQAERQRHKVTVRLPKSEVVNDIAFKRRLQYTEYYKIISLENQLRKEGFLEKQHEIQDFWEFITADGNLEKVLEEGQFSWDDVKHFNLTSAKQQPSQEREPEQGKKKVQFDQTLAKNMTKADHWQSTMHGYRQLMTPSPRQSTSDSETGKESPQTGSTKSGRKSSKPRQSKTSLVEQKFPKVDFPDLAAYRLEFGEREPDPEEVRKAEEAQKRQNERAALRRTLDKMYSHASANRAATQRLMDKNEEFSFDAIAGASSVHELLSHAEVPRASSRTAETRRKESQQVCKTGEMSPRPVSQNTSDRSGRESSAASQSLSGFDELAGPRQNGATTLPPLSLNELQDSCVKREATRPSSLWTNPAFS